MMFIAICKIDDGANIYNRKCIVQAPNEKAARDILNNHYAPGYDDFCYVLNIKEYNIHDGDVFEIQ